VPHQRHMQERYSQPDTFSAVDLAHTGAIGRCCCWLRCWSLLWPIAALCQVFEWQAWLALFCGRAAVFQCAVPHGRAQHSKVDGHVELWMFTIPSLRAKIVHCAREGCTQFAVPASATTECGAALVWKSFPFIFAADVVAVVGVYAWKGVWAECYGIPLGAAAPPAAVAAATGSSSSSSSTGDAAAGSNDGSSQQ